MHIRTTKRKKKLPIQHLKNFFFELKREHFS
jgi:hypothetical protein